MSSEGGATILSFLSGLTGATEPALKLLLTILSGYPLAIIHRYFFYGRPANVQHLYFIGTGFALGYLNYGTEIFHSAFAIFFSYMTLVLLRGTITCVIATFVFNMSYLLIGYYYSGTDDYDINWTMPQCVLVLRVIGLALDLYDGTQPEASLSAKSKELALKKRPTILEYFAHMFFPASFLIGPQFPMRRYQDFISGKFSEEGTSHPPDSVPSALNRCGLGFMYLAIFQILGNFVDDDYIISDEFGELGFLKRCFLLGLWGRYTLYRYISCWLLTEGACILFGLTHNGKDELGWTKWDGLANVNIVLLEQATEFNHYILSFNTNTNHWVAQYIYKRLKFAGNKYISQGSALLFLAVWHGFHSGYYLTFFLEFMVMFMEKDLHSILDKNPHMKQPFQSGPLRSILYILQRIYTFVFMGFCLVPFALLTYDRYWPAFRNVSYSGFIFFLPWPILYGPIFRHLAKATKRRELHQD